MQEFESLAERDCKPSKKGAPPLAGEALEKLKSGLGHDWKVRDGKKLEKQFDFKDFKQALEFTNRVGALAEAQDHHPDIALSWGKVGITLWTHAVGGLSDNDFILAAKVENLPRPAAG
ncbi:MAG: 4a-hydroxytetrahydrobiopterin dehydratase [Fibrobacteres bacterium]|nr:4a-hydroxytetrahydrobiopterin dehydratase [Fibrobacterota bacterium]